MPKIAISEGINGKAVGSIVNSPSHGLALKLSPQTPSASPVLEVAPLSPIENFPIIAEFPCRGIPYAPVQF